MRGIISLIDSTPNGYKIELIQLGTQGSAQQQEALSSPVSD
ncbi:hypothetical protein [Hydrococcus rivularis]|nr:hypothetical protein [Hydrococcus rivularis]